MSNPAKGLAIVVKNSKWTGGVDHYAICDGEGYVIHNMPGTGVRKDSEEDFFSSSVEAKPDEDLVTAAQRAVSEGKLVVTQAIPHEANIVVSRAKAMIGTRYNLLSFNCEHFARKCFEGTAYSTQIQKFARGATAMGLLGLAGIWLFSRRGERA
ncbi:MAG: lecithin retinol acyltransferase family protein [Planctomyces sp.]|jgi:hypothetical protein